MTRTPGKRRQPTWTTFGGWLPFELVQWLTSEAQANAGTTAQAFRAVLSVQIDEPTQAELTQIRELLSQGKSPVKYPLPRALEQELSRVAQGSQSTMSEICAAMILRAQERARRLRGETPYPLTTR